MHRLATAFVLVALAAVPAGATGFEDPFGLPEPSDPEAPAEPAMPAVPGAALDQAKAIRKELGGLKPGGSDAASLQRLLTIAMALKSGPENLKPHDIATLRETLRGAIARESDATAQAVLLQLDAALLRLEQGMGEDGLDGVEGLY